MLTRHSSIGIGIKIYSAARYKIYRTEYCINASTHVHIVQAVKIMATLQHLSVASNKLCTTYNH